MEQETPVLTEVPPPPVAVQPLSPQANTRIWATFWTVLCFGILGLGAYLTPSPDGFGKRAGLFGMPPCGFYSVTGYPCPTCGCTTAVSHFAHGHFITSFQTQPFGFTVAVVALITGVLSIIALITGKWFGPALFTLQWYWRVWVYGSIGIFAFGWAYKAAMIRMGM